MKFKENLNLRKVGDEYMMVSDSDAGLDYTRVISLNESAAYLVHEVIPAEFSPVDWVGLLMERYDVSHETAACDVQMLLEILTEAGVLEQ
ncbi:MAG: PqqD family protein [Bacteroidia bacterium]|nr:PqqD family protein [Bacteroidia bacterium]